MIVAHELADERPDKRGPWHPTEAVTRGYDVAFASGAHDKAAPAAHRDDRGRESVNGDLALGEQRQKFGLLAIGQLE